MSNVSSLRRQKYTMFQNVDTKTQGSNVDLPLLLPDPDTVQQQVEALRPEKDSDEMTMTMTKPFKVSIVTLT